MPKTTPPTIPTEGYTNLVQPLGRDTPVQIFSGHVYAREYGKKGRIHRSHALRSWATYSFWLGAEA